MKLKGILNSRLTAVVLGAAVLGTVGAGASVAAGQINGANLKDNSVTSYKIKDGTIQKRDLTASNFKKFTETSTVKTAITPANTATPSYNGAPVVEVPASPASADSKTSLTTITLEKGTWEISATAQFWHLTSGGGGADLGVMSFSVPGQNGYPSFFSSDIPDGGVNAAQTEGTVVVKLDTETTVVVQGSIRGSDAGQAGASVVATKVAFKQ